MEWNDSEQQAAFREDVRSFLRTRLPAYYQDHESRRHENSGLENDWQQDLHNGTPEQQAAAKEWAVALSEKGWGQPHWPAEYGGASLSPFDQFILKQEFALAEAPEIGGSLVGSTLLVHGTEEQKERFLKPTLTGEIRWAQGFSEPGAGSDLGSLQCRATRDGDEWVINGQKLWTSAGHKANWIFGLFRTDPDAPKHRGITFLLLDATSPGVSVRPIISMGWEHATNETFYEDVRVPSNQVVGEVNRGWYVGMTLLDYERSGIGGAVAHRRNLQELIADVRGGSGTPNRARLERFEITDRYIESEVMFNLALRVASMHAAGTLPNYEASMGKLYSTELAQRVARTGMRTYGLYANCWSPTEEYAPLHAKHTQNCCHTVVGTIAGGSNEIQRNIIATRGLGLPRG
ncbi:MAG: acyl-CoA dehydrogenase family protein [Dehalococcoidia bacterium]|nr:acyl-CoA dehydrogenase family protein [Dehalococcoidia bacterium]HRC87335.1 acyl-CoA dehydrogenase family protein [Thermoanaerobaculia bacterium]